MTVAQLKLEGRIDTAAAARLETVFAARAGALRSKDDGVVLELEEVTYISSMGIRLFVTAVKQFRQRGGAFVTIRPKEQLARDVLETADLIAYLNVVEDRQAAEAQIQLG